MAPTKQHARDTVRRKKVRRQHDRVSRQVVGYALIALAIGAALVNTSDIIADLKDWHGATAPSFVGPFLKQLGTTMVAAIGGKLLP